jgi:BMFP domain-containing protein YqiC
LNKALLRQENENLKKKVAELEKKLSEKKEKKPKEEKDTA